MNLKKRKQILFSLVIIAVLAFFMERTVFSGLTEKLRKLSKQIKLEEEKLKRGLAVQKGKDKIIKDYKDFSPYLSIEAEDRQIIAKFLKEVENISQVSGVSVVSLNPDNQPEITKEFKRFKAEFRLDTDMEHLFNFLDRVQESKLLIKINKLSLTSRDEQSGILRLEATISIAVPLE